MKSHRSIIRAILFIVRLQVAAQHLRRRTIRRRNTRNTRRIGKRDNSEPSRMDFWQNKSDNTLKRLDFESFCAESHLLLIQLRVDKKSSSTSTFQSPPSKQSVFANQSQKIIQHQIIVISNKQNPKIAYKNKILENFQVHLLFLSERQLLKSK